MDLLLHFDLTLGSKSVVQSLIEKHVGLLDSLVTRGLFSGVWIFDQWTKSVVWNKARRGGR